MTISSYRFLNPTRPTWRKPSPHRAHILLVLVPVAVLPVVFPVVGAVLAEEVQAEVGNCFGFPVFSPNKLN